MMEESSVWVVAFGELPTQPDNSKLGYVVKVVGWLPGSLGGIKSLVEAMTQLALDGAVLFKREIQFPEINKWISDGNTLDKHPDAKTVLLTSIGQAKVVGIEA